MEVASIELKKVCGPCENKAIPLFLSQVALSLKDSHQEMHCIPRKQSGPPHPHTPAVASRRHDFPVRLAPPQTVQKVVPLLRTWFLSVGCFGIQRCCYCTLKDRFRLVAAMVSIKQ